QWSRLPRHLGPSFIRRDPPPAEPTDVPEICCRCRNVPAHALESTPSGRSIPSSQTELAATGHPVRHPQSDALSAKVGFAARNLDHRVTLRVDERRSRCDGQGPQYFVEPTVSPKTSAV